MGIIRAVMDSVKGGLADQWLEVIEPAPMRDSDCLVPGQKVNVRNGRGSNLYGTDNIVSNGSMIHVYDNQFMMLIDGGKVVDYTAEPGYYKVDNSAAPSLFNGQFKDTLKDAFNRMKFGGVPSQVQRVFYINLQELKGINFGTPSPVNYYDAHYDAELFVRAHGSYTVKITNPLLFYAEAVGKDAITQNLTVNFAELHKRHYLGEFMTAFSSALNQMSVDGIRISFVKSKSAELAKYMAKELDEEWEVNRGMVIQSVSVDISYDEESRELIKLRNQGAMMSQSNVQQGYLAKNIAEGLKAAGGNSAGAMTGFLGMGLGMNAGSSILGGYQQNNMAQQQYAQQQQQPQMQPQMQPQQQPQMQQPQAVAVTQPEPQPQAQAVETQPQEAPSQAEAPTAQAPQSGAWICQCGTESTGKFCPNCGTKKPENQKRFCAECGNEVSQTAKFCPNCGNKL